MSESTAGNFQPEDSIKIKSGGSAGVTASSGVDVSAAMDRAASDFVKKENIPEYADQQTTKQPVFWFCSNPDCRANPLEKPSEMFKFERDEPKCPKCTSGPPVVHKMALIHLVVPDQNGQIFGDQKRRFILACDPKRDYIATRRNGEAGSGDPNCITCPGCIALVKKHIEKIIRNRIALTKR